MLAARIIEEKRLAAKCRNLEANVEKPLSNANEKKLRPSNTEMLDQLKNRFQSEEYSRAQAIDEVKKIAGYSLAKTGRILRSGIDTNNLYRIREGWYAFKTSAKCQTNINTPNTKPALKRSISEKQRSSLRILQDNMLYLNFKAKLERLNPGKDIEQLINRDLEPQEALEDLHRKYPNLIIFNEVERDFRVEFRDYLSFLGIENTQIQDPVIARMESDNPFTEDELKAFAQAQTVAVSDKSVISVEV